MKKIITSVVVAILLCFNFSTTSYAFSLEDYNTYYKYYAGEYARPYYEDQILGKYNEKDKDSLNYCLDELSIEYMVLADIICWTDKYVFINEDCVARTYFDMLASIATTDDDTATKIDMLNGQVSQFNGTTKDSTDDYSEGFNMWWASLGSNYKDYIYIFKRINNKIYDINWKISMYNVTHKDNKLEPLIPMNDFYTNNSYKYYLDRYMNMRLGTFKDQLDFYPQGSNVSWVEIVYKED